MAGKKNYNKISTEAKAVNEEAVEIVNEEAVEAAETVNEEVVTGIVCNCNKLNIRKKADVGSKSVGIIERDDEVSIIDDKDNTFYEVLTADSTHGYCMKKYIKIK